MYIFYLMKSSTFELCLSLQVIPQQENVTVDVFGSFARGEESSNSDIDIIVDIINPIGKYQFIELKQCLEAILKKKVDLCKPITIEPLIKDKIMSEAITINEQRLAILLLISMEVSILLYKEDIWNTITIHIPEFDTQIQDIISSIN